MTEEKWVLTHMALPVKLNVYPILNGAYYTLEGQETTDYNSFHKDMVFDTEEQALNKLYAHVCHSLADQIDEN